MIVQIRRFLWGPEGTFGVLIINGRPFCLTCELPWRDNKDEISCIPAGTYPCIPHNGAKFKHVWELIGVPGRADVLIHMGNIITNTKGCILVGERFGTLKDLPAVLGSLSTLDKLRDILPEKFDLEIINP